MWHCCWCRAVDEAAERVLTSSFACSFKSCHSMDFFAASVAAIATTIATNGAVDAAEGCTAGRS